MVKKISTFILAIFGSVLLLCGCGDPYKDLKLTVSSSKIVLYLNEETNGDDSLEETPVVNPDYPSNTSFVIKVSGTGKKISGNVVLNQYAYNGVEDIVKIEPITSDTTSKDGARYKVTALRSGNGVIVVNTVEGGKQERIDVSVYVPIKGVDFKSGAKAIKYGSTLNLNQLLEFTPNDTNQKEMKFYLENNVGGEVITDETGIIETVYAKIENGILTSKNSNLYPIDGSGNQYIRIYGVSAHNGEIKTQVIDLPVLHIVEENNINLSTVTESGNVKLGQTSGGFYEIVLGHNIPNNPFIYARDLIIKITDEYVIDQQYVISTNYNSELNRNSVFELNDKIDEQDRYNYSGLKDLYPYKEFGFSQLKTGSDTLQIFIDRRGYEGLFTITLNVKVTVKDFATSLSATNANNENAIDTGLVLFNAYGGNALGTSLIVNLSPNVNNANKIRLNLVDVPQIDGWNGVMMTLVNATEILDGALVDGGTRIYLKHFYNYEQITEIATSEIQPKLVISYSFNMAPVAGMAGYQDYTITETIPLTMKPGVTDIRIPVGNEDIKINAVTGLAVNEIFKAENNQTATVEDTTEGEGGTEEEPQPSNEIVLATIDNQPANLMELISKVRIVTVNGISSTLNALSNKYFDIVYKEGPLLGQSNRLVIEPKLQSEQAKIVLEIVTNNNITKTVVVDIFVPIIYDVSQPDEVNMEVYNETQVSSSIYDITQIPYKVVLTSNLNIYDGNYEFTDEEQEQIVDTQKYNSITQLTLSVDSKVGFNFYNYIVLHDAYGNPRITKVNYNTNVTISQNREYYTVEYENVNGVNVPHIITKKLKTNTPQNVEIKIVGYDNEGKEIVIKKYLSLNIIEPVTSISLTPVSSTLYTAESLGALKVNDSKLKFGLNVYPVHASVTNKTEIEYSFRNDVLYSRAGRTKVHQIKVEHFISLNEETGEVQAKLNEAEFNRVLDEFKVDSDITLDKNDVLNSIFANNVVVTFYASLKPYTKPEITTSATITLRNATKVEKIIPSVSTNGAYFDSRKITPNYAGETITFNVLPSNANNKTLIASVGDESVVKIVSGVDVSNRIIGNKIVIKPNINAGRTFIRIAAEDSYVIDAISGVAVPTSYLDISIRVANGTKAFPFEINNADEFLKIGEDFEIDSDNDFSNSYYYVLTQSFSLVNSDFNPFGGIFKGGLNGNFSYDVSGVTYNQQNTIYGLIMNKTITPTVSSGIANDYSYGLFKQLSTTAEIENLILSQVQFDFNINNQSFADAINIGGIAGVNYGTITNSSVSGTFNINSNVKNLNVGGLVGQNLSHLNIDVKYENAVVNGANTINITQNKSSVSGVITANATTNSNFVNNTETTNVDINYVGNSSVLNAQVNLGGVAGKVLTYATHNIRKDGETDKISYVGTYWGKDERIINLNMPKDVSVYQPFYNKTISNLVVASSISSVDENGKPYRANIGGAFGFTSSTLIDNVNVITNLHGYSNIGGIVGLSEHTTIQNSTVEFANQGQTGLNTISISGYTNVGGMIGKGTNVNIFYSYVRAYFNNKEIDNSTYYGNIALLESSEPVKNVGGLIGYVDANSMSKQLSSLGAGLDVSTLTSYNTDDVVNSKSANGITKSYFNADINVAYSSLSGVVNAGGFIGDVTNVGNVGVEGDAVDAAKTKSPLNITDSYVYGNLKQPDVEVYTIRNKIKILDNISSNSTEPNAPTYKQKYLNIGTVTTFAIGSLKKDSPTEINSTYEIDKTAGYDKYYTNADEKIKNLINSAGNNLIEIIAESTTETITETVAGVGDAETTKEEYQIQNVTIKVHHISQKFIGSQKFAISSPQVSNEQQVISLKDEIAIKTISKTNTYKLTANLNSDVNISSSYINLNGESGVIDVVELNSFDIFDIVSNETTVNTYSTYEIKGESGGTTLEVTPVAEETEIIVDDNNINKVEINNVISRSLADLTKIESFAGFSIVEADLSQVEQYKTFDWLICEEINSGYPVLFNLQHNNGELLFKVLPTEIKINIIDLIKVEFSNLNFIKDGENLVLFYNELLSGRAYKHVNYYKLISDGENTISGEKENGVKVDNELLYPITVINVDLDIVDLFSKYGINADYDKNMIITSSNPNVVSVEGSNLIQTKSTGKVTLRISSKLDTSIYDTVEILVVNGISDYNIYKSKNLTTQSNQLITVKEIVASDTDVGSSNRQIIDQVSNYFVDSINEDLTSLTDCNGVYAKNSNIGVKVDVATNGTGQAKINGLSLQKGVTYLFTSLQELSFVGTYEGILYLTLTPFIMSNDTDFGVSLTQTANNSFTLDNCILINELTKVYKFQIVPKAESIQADKTSVNLDPVKHVDLTLTTVTSDFVKAGDLITVNETIFVKVTDKHTNKVLGVYALDMSNTGSNSSFINIEILEEYVKETNNVLKVEQIKKLRFSFDANKYKDRTGDVTYNLKDIAYKFEFYPDSNPSITAEFNIQIVPRVVTDIKTSYYPNSESSSSGEFFPQESESEYIVPSRVGLLKIELLPDLNNAEYVELTVNDEMKNYVNFAQQLAIMSGNENSFVTGYRSIITPPDYLPNFKGIRLINQSVIVNGTNIYYNGNFYVQIFLSEDAPINEKITFTATAYKTESGEAVEINKKNIQLTIQPLPTIDLTVNGKSEGLIAKGTNAELEINATNFEGDVEIAVSTLQGDISNVIKRYDIATNKYFVEVGLNAKAGDTVIITATASRYLNGVLEQQTSTVRLFIVEYLIDSAKLEGSTYANGRYQFEALNGTTNVLNVVFDVVSNPQNKSVSSLLTALEQEASGRLVPDGAGGYVNNWWRQISGNRYESLYPNTTYGNYEFVDTTMSDITNSHYFALKTIVVSSNNVISYKMKYYYNAIGVPKLYTGTDYGYDIYELEFDFTFVIKDNSTYDHPNPISNVAEFMALGGLNPDGSANETGAVTEGHYILVNDLNLENYTPFEANFSSLDGNGHIITINSFNTEKYKSQNGGFVGLFEKISNNTIVKNISIDIGNMLVSSSMANATLNGEENITAFIDLSNITSFTFGVLTGENNGSITNAKIINTKQTTMLDNAAKNLLINSTTGYINGNLVDARIGGLVGVNNGSISNSYVGLNATNYENETTSIERRGNVGQNDSVTMITYPFNIVAGKSVAGFVNTNSGISANNYVLGVGVINTAKIFSGAKTAGFAVDNTTNATIFNCMVEGLKINNYRANQNEVYIEGKGYIGGFIYTNSGNISNAYSNIPVKTNSGGSGGFVYINQAEGIITNAYSTVENAVNSLAHGQFTGLDDKNKFNNFGILSSCFYLVLEGETANTAEPATAILGKKIVGDGKPAEDNENQDNTNQDATNQDKDNPFRDTGSFNGFNFASGDDDNNIWQLSKKSMHFGPRLISATSTTTFSHRILVHTTTNENTQETVYDYQYDNSCAYGSEINPLLVNTATEFVTFIINNSKTMTLNKETLYVFGVQTKSKTATNAPYYIRLINDLDFNAITLNNLVVDGKRISDIAFVGKLDGNGMKMTGIRLVDQRKDTVHENFGLFSQIGLNEKQISDENFGSNNLISTAIMNVDITINGFDATQSVKVGTLAGSIYDTSLINVTLNGGEGVIISGRNIVGGLAGLIINSGSQLITDVTINDITVTAAHRSESRTSEVTKINNDGTPYNTVGTNLEFKSYNNNKTNIIDNLRNYSYAGSVAGIIDAVNRKQDDVGSNIKTQLGKTDKNVPTESAWISKVDNKINFPTGTGATNDSKEAISATEAINKHRSKPANNLVSKIIVKGGGFVAAEQAGGMFGYIGEYTHLKNSRYLLGQSSKDTSEHQFVQQIMGHNYAGAIVGENYGMIEQVYVEHIEEYQSQLDAAFNTNTQVAGEITNLFGEGTSIAIGAIAGFTKNSIILDSYSKIDVSNPKAKIAGGLVGLVAGPNYVSHVFVTGNVNAQFRIGGLIGLYNSEDKHYEYTYYTAEDPEVENGSKKIGEVKTTTTYSGLLLDYAFALNEWGTEAREVLFNNLKEYYVNNSPSSGSENPTDTYYNFVLRMPEVGNQKNNNNTDKMKYDTNFIGSLIGSVYAGGENSSISTDDIIKVVSKARKVQVVNNGQGTNYLFSTVLSTTLPNAKITENEDIFVGSGTTPEYYNQPILGGQSSSGDNLEFINSIGNQFTISTILGTNFANSNMFNMFIWDSVATNTSDFAEAGSQVWRLGTTFPEYIIGIFSNFKQIKTAKDIYEQIMNSSDTRNQFYLINSGEYDLLTQNATTSAFRHKFEGSMIGVVDAEGNNPKITLNISNSDSISSIFKELNAATIMNVDFVVNVSKSKGNTNSKKLTNDSEGSQSTYTGFFAKYMNSSVLSNVNFSVNFLKDENGTDVSIEYSKDYQAVGLMVGYLNDSTIQNVNVNVNDGDKTELTVNPVFDIDRLNDASIKSNAISIGGVVGESSRSVLQNVNIVSNNKTNIQVGSNNGTTNIGGVVGLGNNTNISKINDNNIAENMATSATSSTDKPDNSVFTIYKAAEGKIINFGGIIGSQYNCNSSALYFKGNIKCEPTALLNANLRLGGIAGYGENSTLEHANFNEYLYYKEIKDESGVVVSTELVRHQFTGYTISVKNGSSDVASTFVGGILGYGLNFKLRGNTTNALNTSNNSNITVNVSSSQTAVGGIVGYMRNSNENIDVSRVYNLGDINVSVNNITTKSAFVGGIVGNAIGGKYEALYNLGEIKVESSAQYAVGGIIGQAETNGAQTVLKLTKFINFADMFIGYKSGLNVVRPSKADKRFVGGVAGQITGTGSTFKGGYTLARIYDINTAGSSGTMGQFGINNQDNGAINGIAYVETISSQIFENVFFVFDFLPYSNFTNKSMKDHGAEVIVTTESPNGVFGGIEYANLNKVLHNKLGTYFATSSNPDSNFVNYSVANNVETLLSINLPTQFKLDNSNTIIDMVGDVNLVSSTTIAQSGNKLNPIIINDSSPTITTHEIDSTKYYIMKKDAVDNKTIKFSNVNFTGLLTSESRIDYPTIKLEGLTENYGILSNFAVRLNYNNQGMVGIADNNYGNILNCLTYGYITATSTSITGDVVTFVKNNHSNIVQSGSVVMFATNSMNLNNNSFSGFVGENKANAFIKDCYSLTSIINNTVNNGTVLTNVSKLAGFAWKNEGVIETSYFAGSYEDAGVYAAGSNIKSINENVFVNEFSTGTIRNCVYDCEATPDKTGADNFSMESLTSSNDATKVKYARTKDFITKGITESPNSLYGTFLKTQNVPSNWSLRDDSKFASYNYGYPTIKSGIELPTLFTIETNYNLSNPHIIKEAFQTVEGDKTEVYGIFHVGQLNNLGEYQNPDNWDIALLSNIDMSKVNFEKSTGTFTNFISLSSNLYGFNHTISNLKIDAADSSTGLFSSVAASKKVEYLVINNASVKVNSNGNVGILVGINEGTVNNVTINNASVEATSSTSLGALAGLNRGSGQILNSKVKSVTVKGTGNVGGAVGQLSNGTIKEIEISDSQVEGEANIGGAVGYAKKEPTDSSSGTPLIDLITISGNTTIKSNKVKFAAETYRNVDYKWAEKYEEFATTTLSGIDFNNVGGVVGYLGANATVNDPLLSRADVYGHTTAGGVAGCVDVNGRITFNTKTIASSTDSTYLKVGGNYNIGGIAGVNKGTISGNSSKTQVYATVGTEQTADSEKFNANIGGVVGNNLAGTISNMIVMSSKIYGARLVGGIAGFSSGGRIEYSTINSSSIYYNSAMDMDQHTGFMPDLKMGIGNSGDNFKTNNFKTYFGLGGNGSSGVFNGDKTIAYNVIEYGGIESKAAGNYTVPGKEQFPLLFGFICGVRHGSTSTTRVDSVSTNIVGIYDIYRNYIINVTNWHDAGRNDATMTRNVQVGKRVFDMESNTNYYYGEILYKKYTSDFETYGSIQNYVYYLKKYTGDASKDAKDSLKHLKEVYDGLTYEYDKGFMKFLDIIQYSYPGMTWKEWGGLTTDNAKTIDGPQKSYYGADKWFSPIPWYAWQNVNFYEGQTGYRE